MKKLGPVKLSALITVAVVLIFSALQLAGNKHFNAVDVAAEIGLSTVLLGALSVVIGLVACIIPHLRKAGQGMLIGGGILFLIGFSLCSSIGIYN